MSRDEARYVELYVRIIEAVADVRCYVTPALRQAVDDLEDRLGDVSALQDAARRRAGIA